MTGMDLKVWLDRVLVGVVCVVVAGFSLFIMTVTAAFLGFPQGYSLWAKLWYPLFQPALGILMLGAIASGIWGWIRKQRESS